MLPLYPVGRRRSRAAVRRPPDRGRCRPLALRCLRRLLPLPNRHPAPRHVGGGDLPSLRARATGPASAVSPYSSASSREQGTACLESAADRARPSIRRLPGNRRRGGPDHESPREGSLVRRRLPPALRSRGPPHGPRLSPLTGARHRGADRAAPLASDLQETPPKTFRARPSPRGGERRGERSPLTMVGPSLLPSRRLLHRRTIRDAAAGSEEVTR
jgi:hypothetical protein